MSNKNKTNQPTKSNDSMQPVENRIVRSPNTNVDEFILHKCRDVRQMIIDTFDDNNFNHNMHSYYVDFILHK